MKSKKQKRMEALGRWEDRLTKCTVLAMTDGKGTLYNGKAWEGRKSVAIDQITRLRKILGLGPVVG